MKKVVFPVTGAGQVKRRARKGIIDRFAPDPSISTFSSTPSGFYCAIPHFLKVIVLVASALPGSATGRRVGASALNCVSNWESPRTQSPVLDGGPFRAGGDFGRLRPFGLASKRGRHYFEQRSSLPFRRRPSSQNLRVGCGEEDVKLGNASLGGFERKVPAGQLRAQLLNFLRHLGELFSCSAQNACCSATTHLPGMERAFSPNS